MIKIYFLNLFFTFSLIFGQSEGFTAEMLESMGAKKVTINKQMLSHVLVTNKIVNGVATDEKTFGPHKEILYKINISSDYAQSSIKINTKNIMEETSFTFGSVYKMETSDYTYFEFSKINSCSATLMVPKGRIYGNGDMGIKVSCIFNDNNGAELDFSLQREK